MLTDFMRLVSFIGSAGFSIPLLVIVFWCVSARLGARLAVLLSVGAMLNTVLKLFFHAPRPFWTDRSIHGYEAQSSFGMPSGHAQNSVVAWGFLASQTRRRALWAAALVLVVLIGVSRIYLGVHSIGQVLAGWAIGAVFLVVALQLEPIVTPWWSRRPVVVQVVLALAVSLALLGLAWAALRTLDDWNWPETWSEAIIAAGGGVKPLSMTAASAAAGGVFGIIAGLSILGWRGWFDSGGAVWRRLARIPVGGLGAFVVYGIGLFMGDQPVPSFLVQAALGLWATAGAPEAFVRLGLARRVPRAVTRPGEALAEVSQ
ncbi:phosphatase PAP2 family protein [Actinomadura barringtoniae]|uniref:Phosphatase PAP2 family protein n=1 Tax=Actinomadura barringtoniae TaxID=1427535 RepID=A0A939PH91_9ACTN|nr:phosphatase PAP2 family protein [Actinomadura barringtoniae]MBO2452450.1 phosphatase PAP2 family protein [Actinomadura barringtoniae]